MRFEKNPAFQREFEATAEYQAALEAITVALKELVVAAALPFRATGYFIRHLGVRGNRVLSGDPFTHLIEFGSVNNPPYAPLRTGAMNAGMRYDGSREPG